MCVKGVVAEQQQNMDPIVDRSGAKSGRSKGLSMLIKVVLRITLVLLILFLILHIPAVQNKIAQVVTNRLTRSSPIDVAFTAASFSVYSGVQVDSVVLRNRDTQEKLLEVGSLGISPRTTLLSLLSGEVKISDVSLSGTKIWLTRKRSVSEFNWSSVFDPKDIDTVSVSEQQLIDVSRLRLDDVYILYDDEHQVDSVEIRLSTLQLDADKIEVGRTIEVMLSQLILERPSIDVYKVRDSILVTIPKDAKRTSNQDSLTMSVDVIKLIVIDGSYQRWDKEGKLVDQYKDMDLLMRDLSITDPDNWRATVDDVSIESQELDINHITVQEARMVKGSLYLNKTSLVLDKSRLDFDLEIESLKKPIDEMSIALSLRPSKLRLDEFFPINPDLKKALYDEPFAAKMIQIQGEFAYAHGNINARQLAVWINGLHHIQGDIDFTPHREIERSLLSVELVALHSDLEDLERITKRLDIPDELERLGHIQFEGSFDGYLNDFIADGQLNTDMGRADMDLQFNFVGSGDRALQYAGILQLDSFDLSKYTGNPDFGIVVAQMRLKNGVGPNLTHSSADIDAVINQFSFRDVVYQDATYRGALSSRIIDGYSLWITIMPFLNLKGW